MPQHPHVTLPLRVMTILFSPSFPVTVLTVANMSMALMMPSPNSCTTNSNQAGRSALLRRSQILAQRSLLRRTSLPIALMDSP